jgi:hypothetical protein
VKTYKITASYVSYCTAEIEAETQEEAERIAHDMDGGDFTPAQDNDDWTIEAVREVTQ